MSKYITVSYFQKSKNFLFPLAVSEKIDMKGIYTYLMCDGFEDDILEYNLIVKVDKPADIKDKYFIDRIVGMHETPKSTIYNIDLYEWKDDIDSFLQGTYSKFSDKAKKKVLKFFDALTNGGQFIDQSQLKGSHQLYACFFPQKYKHLVAQDLYSEFALFDSENDALKVVKSWTELCPIYDADKETLKLNFIQEVKDEGLIA